MTRRLLAALALVLVASPAAADWHATGRALYRDREQDIDGFTGVEPDRAARRVDIQVLDATTSAMLASGSAGLDGTFDLLVVDAATRNVRVRFLTSSVSTPGLFESVRISQANPALYSVTSPTINAHAPTANVNFGDLTALPGAGGEAFNIFDVLLNGLDYAKLMSGSWPASAVVAYWQTTSTDGTFFRGTDNSIHLLGAVGYDDAVIGHEEGHFAAKVYSKDNSPGGQHFLGDNHQDIRLALSEGWATYFSCSVRRRLGVSTPPITEYVTTTGAPGPGNLDFSYDLEGPSVGAAGAASEVSVQAALWECVDNAATADLTPGTDDDPVVDRTDEDVWEVIHNYLPQGSVTNVSLEDFWDGWFRPGFSHDRQTEMTAAFDGLQIEFHDDAFEDDDAQAQAVPIAPDGLAQHRTFYGAGDNDWSWFVGLAGQTHVIETTDLLSDANTTISVFDSLGNSQASNDDRAAGDESSKIVFVPGITGRYFVRAQHAFDLGVYGSYDLRVFRAAPSGVTFTDVTAASGAGSSASSRGVAWADYDVDGWPDIYVCNVSAANALFRNNQNGTFTNTAAAAGVALNTSSEGACFGDFDNDGDLDLYVATVGNVDALYENRRFPTGTATFLDVTAGSGITDTGSGRTANWVDVDGDGRLDLFVANLSGSTCKLWYNDGGGHFHDITASHGLALSGVITSAWADYDNDGDLDVFLGVNGGPSHLLRNDSFAFTDVTGPAGTVAGEATFAAEWGDFDGDGWIDLFVADSDGPDFLYRNLGNGTFVDVAQARGVASSWMGTGAAFADMDLDTDQDLYISNFNAASQLFENLTGSAFSLSGAAGAIGNSRGAAWADYDRDGDPDLYVSSEGADILYRNNAPARPWLAVDLVGSVSNRFGIGSRIRVVAGGKRQTRQVTAGFAFGCQAPLRALFGLGAGTVVIDSLVVDWPSHRQTIMTSLAINQTVAIGEPTPLGAPPAFVLALAPPTPNPTRSDVSFAVTLPSPGRVSLEVVSASGRLVSRLYEGSLFAGPHRFSWNLRDDGGARVGSGLYFATLTAGGETRRAKVVVLSGAR